MIAYALPTTQIQGNSGSETTQISRILWVPGPNRFAWGELE